MLGIVYKITMGKWNFSKEATKFLAIAISMILALSIMTSGFGVREDAPIVPPVVKKVEDAPRVVVLRDTKTIDLTEPLGMSLPYEEPLPEEPVVRKAKPRLPKAVKTYSGKTGRVVIIIDDMGMTKGRDAAVVAMPGPLTLAYLPYAPGVREEARRAKAAGHELLVHTPMEPMDGHLDMGPIALRGGMGEEAFKEVLETKVLTAFEGYIGINNHMGSRLTQDPEAMEWVMEVLKAKGLIFVDSVTINSSIAAATAQSFKIPFAERDVFLDHFDTEASVHKVLAELERRAKEQGYAVAIGHPKPHTIAALKQWLPGMKERGLELVPVSKVLERP